MIGHVSIISTIAVVDQSFRSYSVKIIMLLSTEYVGEFQSKIALWKCWYLAVPFTIYNISEVIVILYVLLQWIAAQAHYAGALHLTDWTQYLRTRLCLYWDVNTMRTEYLVMCSIYSRCSINMPLLVRFVVHLWILIQKIHNILQKWHQFIRNPPPHTTPDLHERCFLAVFSNWRIMWENFMLNLFAPSYIFSLPKKPWILFTWSRLDVCHGMLISFLNVKPPKGKFHLISYQ